MAWTEPTIEFWAVCMPLVGEVIRDAHRMRYRIIATQNQEL